MLFHSHNLRDHEFMSKPKQVQAGLPFTSFFNGEPLLMRTTLKPYSDT